MSRFKLSKTLDTFLREGCKNFIVCNYEASWGNGAMPLVYQSAVFSYPHIVPMWYFLTTWVILSTDRWALLRDLWRNDSLWFVRRSVPSNHVHCHPGGGSHIEETASPMIMKPYGHPAIPSASHISQLRFHGLWIKKNFKKFSKKQLPNGEKFAIIIDVLNVLFLNSSAGRARDC